MVGYREVINFMNVTDGQTDNIRRYKPRYASDRTAWQRCCRFLNIMLTSVTEKVAGKCDAQQQIDALELRVFFSSV